MTPNYRLPAEVHSGLYQMLLGLAEPSAEGGPYALLTTTPSLVLPYCSPDATVYDLGPLFGSNDWVGAADLRSGLVAQLMAVGWPPKNIAMEHRVQLGKRTVIADVVLRGDDGAPLVVVKITGKVYAGRRLREMTDLFVADDFPQAYVYDGTSLLKAEDRTGKDTSPPEVSLPRPEDFGLMPVATDGEGTDEGITVTRVTTVDELMTVLDGGEGTPRPFVLDHTVPWGTRGGYLETLHERLPDELRSPRVVGWDVPTLLLVLLAAKCRTVRSVVAVVPPAFMQSYHAEAARRFIGSRLSLAGGIDLPRGVFDPAIGIAANVLLLGRFAELPSEQAVFLALDGRGDIIAPSQQAWWEPLSQSLRGVGRPAPPVFTAAVEEGAPFSARAHDPAVRAVEEGVKRLAKTVPLGDLFDTVMGHPYPREEASGNNRGTSVIRGRDLAAPTLKQEDLTRFVLREDARERSIVQEGDVLIQRIGDRPRCLYVSADLAGAVASDTILILRPKDPRADGRFLCQFLRSQTGQALLTRAAMGVHVANLSVRILHELPVPDLSEIADDLKLLQEVEDDLRARADFLSAARLGLFGAESRDVFDNRLREMRSVGRTTALSLRQAEAPDFQIRNFYPFPLAFPYRTLSSITVPSELYKEQLRVAENVLAFLGSVTLAVLDPVDYPKTELQPRELWSSGISPGHWRTICQKGATILKGYQGNALAEALAALWESRHKPKKDFRDSMDALIKAKNDFKHDRGPKTEEEMRPAAESVQKHLDLGLAELRFFTQHPIHLVRDMDLVRNSRTVLVQTLQYTGDHPGLQQERLEYHEPLKKNDLYIDGGSGVWTSLYPFVTACYCRSCGTREVYFIDYWDTKKGVANLKSFERGHTTDPSGEAAACLVEWAAQRGEEGGAS